MNRVWEGETVVIICGGPSLTVEQVERTRGLRTIAVNDAYLLAPWADVCYFADAKWLKWQLNGRDGKGLPALGLTGAEVQRLWREFRGLKVAVATLMQQMRGAALFIRDGQLAGIKAALSTDPTAIMTGHTSAFQALNVSVLAGAHRVAFIGLDGRVGDGGKKHWFGDHPDNSDAPYDHMNDSLRSAALHCKALGVDVVNCSPGTSITAFRRARLEDELAAGVVARQDRATLPA